MIIIVEDSKPPLVPQEDRTQAAAGQLNGHFGSVHSPSTPSSTPHLISGAAPTPSHSYDPSYHTGTAPLLRPPPPPPSYPNYHHPAPPIPPHTAAPLAVYRQSPVKRFWKAFAFAFLFYLVILSLGRTIVRMASPGRGGDHWGVGSPRDEDGRVLETIGRLNWTSHHTHPRWAPPSYSDSAETFFLLPIASEDLYLISRGAYQSGKVQLKQSADQGGNDVRVDVRVAYRDERALDRATVCRLRKSGNKHGVGIYTPTVGWPGGSDQLYFEVVFTFPAATSEDVPVHIRGLTTQTSNFAYEIGDLWRSISFDNVELKTSNAAIRANSMTLTKGSLTSSNGQIVGHFNTSDTLILHTSNARIQVTASLLHAGGDTTKLDMRTSNGPITSSVSLITESGSGGQFAVTSHSSNGAIQLQYDDLPLRTRLVSEVRTSNSAAAVVMHPAFEGSYEVVTSNHGPVVRDTHPTDPSGAGRRRVVNQTVSRRAVSGTVYWAGNEGGRRGGGSTCTVHTSNAGASLNL